MAADLGNLSARVCEECAATLSRNHREAPSAWARRRFCSVKCARTFGPRRAIERRLAAKTDTQAGHGPDGDCHHWLGAKTRDGYGSVRFEGRSWLAHRLVHHITNAPVSDDVLVCHNCDNPSCVNPQHLFCGTQQDNMDDMVLKGRQRSRTGSDHANSKLTEADVLNIRSDRRTHKVIAMDYGVSRGLVSLIKRGAAWKHTLP